MSPRRYLEIPLITRVYLTGSMLTTAACSLELVSPFSLYFNMRLVFIRMQVWRLFTNFFFFGSISLDFFFHMFFLVRYCRMLEEGSFRGRPADFLLMLLFGGTLLCLIAPFINIPPFLGSSLAFMMVYVWGRCAHHRHAATALPPPRHYRRDATLTPSCHSCASPPPCFAPRRRRRNEYVRMSFLGLFQFRAPFLPWVLLGFSILLGHSPTIDLMGIAVGHVYFYIEDVFHTTPAGRGRRPLKTPRLLKLLVGQFDRASGGGAEEELLRVDQIAPLAPAQQLLPTPPPTQRAPHEPTPPPLGQPPLEPPGDSAQPQPPQPAAEASLPAAGTVGGGGAGARDD